MTELRKSKHTMATRLACWIGCSWLLGLSLMAHSVEVLTWERLPLQIPLVVGQERVVLLDRDVRVGVPASAGSRLRVQSADGALYLLARAPLQSTRVQLQDVADGRTILLDLVAREGSEPLEPVRILAASAETESASEAPPNPARETPVPVLLTRYAAQSLYAPLRTVEPVTGLARGNLPPRLVLDRLLPDLPVDTRALAAWRLDDYWLTAVWLRNRSDRWLTLDPRALQGQLHAASFQHPDLGPAGTPEDTTVVYLVTRGQPLAAALPPAVRPFDAAVNRSGEARRAP